jgi:8-oxo-dGTP pyrophosphatase MutT (NUDIX family)
MADFHKAGLLLVKDGRVLLCRKKHTTSLLILPGGTLEPGETAEDCLRRECREELGDVEVSNLSRLGDYESPAAGQDHKIVRIELYEGELQGVPAANSEIQDLVWFGPRDDAALLAPSLRNVVFPDLRRRGLLPPASPTPPPREAWAKWISPETLLSQVYNTAPYLKDLVPAPEPGRLIEMGGSPDGFLRILASWENIRRPNLNHSEQLQDYFALCMACHHATVATFVPTDVDTKIRGIAWRETPDVEVLKPMMRFALGARAWTEEGISTRSTRGVSGHNGEHWSAIAGGLGHMLELGDTASAEEAQAAIEAEIVREQAVFDQVAAERDGELDLLRLAMTLAHNRGDLTQGMGFWKKTPVTLPLMEHLATRGRFELAVRIYQDTGLSAEGHRHYPLRPVKALRRTPATLLPLCPFLDDWGGVVAKLEENHEVLAALVMGCQKLKGQQGYYRAIAGMYAASSGAFDRAASRMPNATQRLLRTAEMRKLIDVPRVSFESMMRKRARASLTRLRDSR